MLLCETKNNQDCKNREVLRDMQITYKTLFQKKRLKGQIYTKKPKYLSLLIAKERKKTATVHGFDERNCCSFSMYRAISPVFPTITLLFQE
jgi:hypothetical protein